LLYTNAAPSLQAKALELERQRATDNLKKGLGKRPERGELVDREFFLVSFLFLFARFCFAAIYLSSSSSDWPHPHGDRCCTLFIPDDRLCQHSQYALAKKPTQKRLHNRRAPSKPLT